MLTGEFRIFDCCKKELIKVIFFYALIIFK